MSVLSIRYFDEPAGTWGLKAPQSRQQQQQLKSVTLTAVNLGVFAATPMKDADRCAGLSELLQPLARQRESASVVALLDVTTSLFAVLLQQPLVRKNYGVTDLHPMRHKLALIGGGMGEEEAGCVFLVRHGVPVDFTASLAKQVGGFGAPRPCTALHMRSLMGGSCVIAAATVDPFMKPERVAEHVHAIFTKLDSADTVIVAANFYQAGSVVTSAGARADINMVRESLGFAEANELCSEPSVAMRQLETSVWTRISSRLHPLTATPLAPSSDVSAPLYRSGASVVFAPRSPVSGSPSSGGPTAAAPGAPPGNFSIPQPRSAGKKTDSPATTTTPSGQPGGAQHQADLFPAAPAATAAAAATTGAKDRRKLDSDRAAAVAAAAKWQNHNVVTLRPGGLRQLSAEEQQYDLSSRFPTVKDALEALKSGAFSWPSDYCIIGNVILAAEGATSDFKGFRRYAQANPPPRAPSSSSGGGGGGSGGGGSHSGPQAATPPGEQNIAVLLSNARKVAAAGGSGSTSEVGRDDHGNASSHHPPQQQPPQQPSLIPPQTRVMQKLPIGPNIRPRFWSEASTALVFQVTPIEMRFDITPYVGVSAKNLETAVRRLNGQLADPKTKPDPLHEFGFDYALLYCAEKQGYWLLSANDRPCDILACRQSAFLFVPG